VLLTERITIQCNVMNQMSELMNLHVRFDKKAMPYLLDECQLVPDVSRRLRSSGKFTCMCH